MNQSLTPADKAQMVELFKAQLDDPTTRVVWIRPPIPDTPLKGEDGVMYDNYKAGPTLYFILANGPENSDLEKAVRAQFAHADHYMKSAEEERQALDGIKYGILGVKKVIAEIERACRRVQINNGWGQMHATNLATKVLELLGKK